MTCHDIMCLYHNTIESDTSMQRNYTLREFTQSTWRSKRYGWFTQDLCFCHKVKHININTRRKTTTQRRDFTQNTIKGKQKRRWEKPKSREENRVVCKESHFYGYWLVLSLTDTLRTSRKNNCRQHNKHEFTQTTTGQKLQLLNYNSIVA